MSGSSDIPRLSLIAPCYNEEGNVAELTRRALAAFDGMPVPAELVLVDDGSKDATWACIEEAKLRDPRVQGGRHLKNRGIEGGWRTGLSLARGDAVCLIDSDLQNRPEDVPRLWEAYAAGGADIVQAVRKPGVVHSRRLFSRGLNHLLNVTFGMNLRDNKSGFVLCKKELLATLLEHRFRYRYFQSFIGAAAGVRGCRIHEVETEFEPRHAGQSFLSNYPIKVSLTICSELVKYRLETIPISIARR